MSSSTHRATSLLRTCPLPSKLNSLLPPTSSPHARLASKRNVMSKWSSERPPHAPVCYIGESLLPPCRSGPSPGHRLWLSTCRLCQTLQLLPTLSKSPTCLVCPPSPKTLVQAFVISHLDYCNCLLSASPRAKSLPHHTHTNTAAKISFFASHPGPSSPPH